MTDVLKIPDVYLGDGVYAHFDGYHIVLDLRMESKIKIALEPKVIDALLSFRHDIHTFYKGVDDS